MSVSLSSMLKRHCGRHLFQVVRNIKGSGRMAGFVVDFSECFILFHVVDMDAFRLNGYSVIRRADVRKHRAFDKREFWQYRAVRRFKLTPVRPAGVSLVSAPLLLGSIDEQYPLFTIHPERTKSDVCYIGHLLSMNAGTFTIDDLNSNAEWSGPRRLKFKDVTRVDFGGGYENALAATAPKRPKRKEWDKARQWTQSWLRQAKSPQGI
jgi:hypothetical protein